MKLLKKRSSVPSRKGQQPITWMIGFLTKSTSALSRFNSNLFTLIQPIRQ